jgi:hypothetical protein
MVAKCPTLLESLAPYRISFTTPFPLGTYLATESGELAAVYMDMTSKEASSTVALCAYTVYM